MHKFVLVGGLLAVLVACSDGSDAGSTAAPSSSSSTSLQGIPPDSITVGSLYSFTPILPAGSAMKSTFAIEGRPVWAQFDLSTGTLSGAPTSAELGLSAAIIITAVDSSGAALLAIDGSLMGAVGPFTIRVNPLSVGGAPDPGVTPPPAAPPVGSTPPPVTPPVGGTPPPPAPPLPPSIGGTPSGAVVANMPYSFTPSAADPYGDALTFSIQNAPSWATFSSGSGELFGTPTAADVGTFSGISVSVSDGARSASLAQFSIVVT